MEVGEKETKWPSAMVSIGCSVSYEMFNEVWEVDEVG